MGPPDWHTINLRLGEGPVKAWETSGPVHTAEGKS